MTRGSTSTRIAVIGGLALGFAALWIGVGSLQAGTVQLISFTLINVLLAQSMSVLTGMAGQISLGHAGFFGLGAYGTAIAVKKAGLSILFGVPIGVAVAAAMGGFVSIVAGRVREFYLAMMTLGFGMIFYEVIREWTDVTGGVVGLPGVPSPQLRTLVVAGWRIDGADYCRILLLIVAAALLLVNQFSKSYQGRAYFAVRANEIAASSLGIDAAAIKRQSYIFSAALAGLAGGLYAHLVGYLGPDSFGIGRSIEILVMAIVGGIGSVAGPVLGAALFTWLPESLQIFADNQYIVYGLILIVAFTLMPQGLAGLLLPAPRFMRVTPSAPQAAAEPLLGRDASAAGDAVLAVEQVTRRFGGLVAVDDVSLDIRRGTITALIGPNGSGKSTLVNVVSGLYAPNSGVVRLNGEIISDLPDYAIARRGLARIFQDPRLVSHFTVRENVALGAHRAFRHGWIGAVTGLGGAAQEERAALAQVDAALAQVGLTDVADREVEGLPYGVRRLVEIARAIVTRPDVLLLDEPAAGLTEPEMRRLEDVVRRLKRASIAILLIEHHMDVIAALADDVAVLESGKIIYRGDAAGMRRDPRVAAAYFGARGDATHA